MPSSIDKSIDIGPHGGIPLGECVRVRYSVAVGFAPGGSCEVVPRWMANAMARQGRCTILGDPGGAEAADAPPAPERAAAKGRR